MTSRPWMPFYVADYLADTGHLRTVEHGAYLLLIMHYWRTGGLPTEDTKLAKITRLPLKAWTDNVRPAVAPLFREGWKHKRIDQEIEKQNIIAEKRSIAGRKGGAITSTSRINLKSNSLINHAPRQAIAKQTGGNHSHISTSSLSPEYVPRPQAAADKGLSTSSGLEATIIAKGWK
jgi:uncharacterized protein YdaU (DUF1376 family)